MSAPKTILDIDDVPSEEDEDYVPAVPSKSNRAGKRRKREDAGGSESSSESDSDDQDVAETKERKRSRSAEDETEEQRLVRKKREAEEAWKCFLEQGDEQKEQVKAGATTTEEMVEVRRPRKFAGEVIYETVLLPASHPDVKNYAGPPPAATPDDGSSASPLPRTPAEAGSTAEPTPKPKGPPLRKRPRQSLESMNAAIAANAAGKKMTTLEKSHMDWKSHTAALDTAAASELEANRRQGGGGFLEKQEFLSRVGERAHASRDAAAGKKGRR